MTRRVSIADLLASTTLFPAEAVAIVQQLICGRALSALRRPLGPPTAETVFVSADGSVTCDTSDAPLAVPDLAALLESMLPAAKAGQELALGMPGALRYTLARARLEVDAPPFDSVDDFSRALARHERGDRTEIIQRVIARANGASAQHRLDRRRTDPAVAHLRRQLRVADARVYDQQRAIDALSAMSRQPRTSGKRLALAAGIAIGLTVSGAGQLTRSEVPGPRTTSAVNARVAPESAAPSAPQPSPEQVSTQRVEPVAKTAPASPPAKRAVRTATLNRDKDMRPHRFRWLKTRFVFRNDPL